MDEKKTASVFPLKCFFRFTAKSSVNTQMAVIVSKRRFKHAVDRNRVKRLIREAYRQQKNRLSFENHTCQLCWMFIGSELPTFQNIYDSVTRCIDKINAMNGETSK